MQKKFEEQDLGIERYRKKLDEMEINQVNRFDELYR